jgi:hypothetical protein
MEAQPQRQLGSIEKRWSILTENDDMSDADVLERPALAVDERLVHLLEDLESFDDVAKDGVPAIEVLNRTVVERDEELGTARPRLGRAEGHRDGPERAVLELWRDLGREVACRSTAAKTLGLQGGEEGDDRLATGPGRRRVAGLGDKVLRDWGEARRKEGRSAAWQGKARRWSTRTLTRRANAR